MNELCAHTLVFTCDAAFSLCRRQKAQPAKKEKKPKKEKKAEEQEDDGSRDLGAPVEKKAPHPLAVLDKEAKSPLSGDTWKKV